MFFCLGLSLAPGVQAQSTFYDAYELGLRAENDGRWGEAVEHFQKALSLRPAAGRRVKTYGLNFLDVYDPHLHLSRSYLALGKNEEAARALAESRRQGVSPASQIEAVEKDLARLKASKSGPALTVPAGGTAPAALPGAKGAVPSGPAPSVPVPTSTFAPPESTPLPRLESGPVEAPRHAATPAPAGFPPAQRTERQAPPMATAPPAVPTASVLSPEKTPETSPAALPAAATPAPSPLSVPGQGPATAPPAGWVAALTAGAAALIAALVLLLRKRSARPSGPSGAPARSPSTPTARESLKTLGRTTHLEAAGRATQVESSGSSGSPFGGYTLEKVLGHGGMGTTFLARRSRDGFPVVVKVPHDHLLSKPEFVSRFLLEGSLGATLHHPGIIRIYEAGEVEGIPYIAMELVEGTSLEKLLENGQRLPVRQALEITREIALALDYAHMKGVVHRDLKPENIMILPTGHAKVMDYGIARILGSDGLTATGIYVGTPVYSAPESLSPSAVDTQSDLYSLGIILFRMLSGQLPFVSPNPLEVLQKHSSEPLPPFADDLSVPAEVRGLVERLTAKKKEERFATAEVFLRELDSFLNRAPGPR